MKKFEIINEGQRLSRIKALIDIPRHNVKKGHFGGFIENEENLSHDNDAWIADNAMVFGNAWVFGNALVSDRAEIFDNAKIGNEARVFHYAQVSSSVHVLDEAHVFGEVWLDGKAVIGRKARIQSPQDYVCLGPLGSRNSYLTAHLSEGGIIVSTGCFSDTIEKFENEVKNVHKNNEHERKYKIAITCIKALFQR